METLSTGNTFLRTPTSDSYFTLTKVVNICDLSEYERLLNWLSSEFTLYLQEESDSLKVYFPNGWFNYEKTENINGVQEVRIVIESKCKKSSDKINEHLTRIVNHFNLLLQA